MPVWMPRPWGLLWVLPFNLPSNHGHWCVFLLWLRRLGAPARTCVGRMRCAAARTAADHFAICGDSAALFLCRTAGPDGPLALTDIVAVDGDSVRRMVFQFDMHSDLLNPAKSDHALIASSLVGGASASRERSISDQPKMGNFWTCDGPAWPAKVSQLSTMSPSPGSTSRP
jgi:hypothetical protein